MPFVRGFIMPASVVSRALGGAALSPTHRPEAQYISAMQQENMPLSCTQKTRYRKKDARRCSSGDLQVKTRTSVGVCQGTLGELYQGPTPEGANDEIAVISALIPLYSWVFFTPAKHDACTHKDALLEQSDRWKTFRAIDEYCRMHDLPWPQGNWNCRSELQVGRGLASSTADIVAALRCLGNIHRKPVSEAEFLQILSKIERSDSVFLDTPVIFSSSNHRIIRRFGKTNRMYAAYMHEEKKIDTEKTKNKLVKYYNNNIENYKEIYNSISIAFERKDIKRICDCSTASAELSQGVVPKRYFSNIISQMDDFQADGLIVAHTGSAIGYLFTERPDIPTLEEISLFFSEFNGHCNLVEVG